MSKMDEVCMEVKAGYKQTEVGVIPEDWELVCAKEIGQPVRGGSPRPAGDPRYFNGSYIPWLTVAALTNIPSSQLIVDGTVGYLTEAGANFSRTLFPETLIIANSGATLGVAKILGIKCCANDGIAALLNIRKNCSSYYLAHYINSKTSYLRDVVATGNGQPNLNTELIGNLLIPLPPTKAEQEAIAEALSDADALIASLEQLIAKKRSIKQGAMQALLTGKQRLPGFEVKPGYQQTEVGEIPVDWDILPIGMLSACFSGGTPSSSNKAFYGGSIPWITSGDLNKTFISEVEGRITEDGLTNSSAKIIEPGALLLALYGATAGVCAISNIRAAINQAVLAIIPSQLNTHFLFQYLRWRKDYHIKTFTQGGQPNFSGEIVKSFLIPVPPTKAEQTAIATILSDMDTEIITLEAKLAKARQLKQGMMQELLTGKIRLVEKSDGA